MRACMGTKRNILALHGLFCKQHVPQYLSLLRENIIHSLSNTHVVDVTEKIRNWYEHRLIRVCALDTIILYLVFNEDC